MRFGNTLLTCAHGRKRRSKIYAWPSGLKMGAKRWLDILIASFLLGLAALLLCVGLAHAKTAPLFTEENIIRGILGEARGEGDVAMYAHACAIRNRQNLKGVFGAAAQMEPIPAELWHRAGRAWHTSAYEGDLVNGATHWLSDYDKRHCKSWRLWISDYQAVARVGTTTFYRRKKS